MFDFDLDPEACHRIIVARDVRYDGRFYTGVVTTGIFCRPVCPARTPLLRNCRFYPSAAAALGAGFRPCLRCRPECAPGSAGWRGVANTVSRALSLIAEGAMDGAGVEALAARVGVGGRHLRRLFDRHVGASPVAVAQAHRLMFAKGLIVDSALSMTDVALAAGYGSVRRFNEAVSGAYGRSPSSLRRHAKAPVKRSDGAALIRLRLAYAEPFAWEAMLSFLAPRAVAGVEAVADGAYRRTFSLGAAQGRFCVHRAAGESGLIADIETSDVAALAPLAARIRCLFDLDADSAAIDARLSADPLLGEAVRAMPGVRIPGCWDPFEALVRAMLGQQVSVAAATTFAARLAQRFGAEVAGVAGAGPTLVFPDALALAGADLSGIGLTKARADALQRLARAVSNDATLLYPGASADETAQRLSTLPGIGAWTAHYTALRGLREPDAFPAADLGVLKALAQSGGNRPSPAQALARAQDWRPWRSYAVMRLWLHLEAARPRSA